MFPEELVGGIKRREVDCRWIEVNAAVTMTSSVLAYLSYVVVMHTGRDLAMCAIVYRGG